MPDHSFPQLFIVKEAWPLTIWTEEGIMCADTSGGFGVSDFILSYCIKGPKGWHGTGDLLALDVTYWNVNGDPQEPKKQPEQHAHYHYLFATEGYYLLDASSQSSENPQVPGSDLGLEQFPLTWNFYQSSP
jgi:hypothetical protein